MVFCMRDQKKWNDVEANKDEILLSCVTQCSVSALGNKTHNILCGDKLPLSFRLDFKGHERLQDWIQV